MSSDSSDSGSDSDGEIQFDPNVMKVFKAMKAKLDSSREKQTSNMSSRLKACDSSTTNLRKLLYKSFSIDDHDKNQTTKIKTKQTKSAKTPDNCEKSTVLDFYIDKASNKSLGKTVVEEKEEPHIDFVIDKGPSTVAHCTRDNEEDTEVFTVDLSEINERTNLNVEEESEVEEEVKEVEKRKKKKKNKNRNNKANDSELSSSLQTCLSVSDVYLNVDPYMDPGQKTRTENGGQKHKEPEIMKKSVMKDDFEKQDEIATNQVSVRQQKKQRKAEREKTKGEKWFHMPATELTEERKNDLMVLQMRKALDPKRFYKANDLKAPPKYFQFGTVVESKADFYHSRIPKKQRKATIVEELLADSEFRQYNKRKYEEIQEAKRQGHGPYKYMKKLKMKKKKK